MAEQATEERPTVRGALAYADFRALLVAFAASRAGDLLYGVALVVVVLDRTGEPSYVATLAALRILPFVLLSPLAGVLADRVDRIRLMVVSDLARAQAMVVLGALVAAEAPVWTLIAVATIGGVAGTPHTSAFMATLPSTLPERQLAGGNALIGTVEYVAIVVGPAAAAGLLVLDQDAVAFVVNAATFVLSAVLIGRVGRRRTAAAVRPHGPAAPPPRLVAALQEGVAALRSDRNLLALTGCLVAVTTTLGFEMVYLVLVSDRLLDLGTSGVGVLEATIGVGGVLGVGLAARLARSTRPRLVVALILVAATLPMALLSLTSSPAVAVGLLLVEGAGSVALDVVVITTMQRVVAADRMARVDGILASLATLGVLVGTLVAAPLLALVDLRTALVVAGLVPAGVALVALAASQRIDARSRVAVEVLAPLVEGLQRSGAFSGVPLDRLERLARVVTVEQVPAGTELLRQGDPADALLVLVSGSCRVTVDGCEVNTVTAPGFVGEIGVLQRRPRTATVTAAEPVEVLRVPAADFLRSTRVRGALTALSTTADSRLANAAPSSSVVSGR